MSDYIVYLNTVAALAPLHGLFKVEQIEGDSVHTTTKRPVGEHGVKDFNQRADEVEVLENHLLGRRFGAGNIIGGDCDGWIPPEDWTNGTGYREMSASGTGAHIICRIAGELPQKNKIKLSAEKSKKYGVGGEIELFLGEGNGLALTGKGCDQRRHRFRPLFKGRAVHAVIEDELKKEDGKDYLWDAKTGGTGKSTHMRMFTGFFSKYLTTTGWKTFTGVNDENGEWLGKIGVECEEAGVNRIKDVEAIKSRTSGGWELKKLYAGRMSIRHPLLLSRAIRIEKQRRKQFSSLLSESARSELAHRRARAERQKETGAPLPSRTCVFSSF